MRERFRDLLLGGKVETDEYDAETIASPALLGKRDLELVLGNQARLNEALAEFLSHLQLVSTYGVIPARGRTRTIRPDGSRKTIPSRAMSTTILDPIVSPTVTTAPSTIASRRS